MKSKKSKTSSKRREWSRSPSDDRKSKRSKPRLKSAEKDKKSDKGKDKVKAKVKDKKSVPRKSRWQEPETSKSSKDTPAPVPQKSVPTQRIKDHLNDKEKIVDLLFQTVPGETLQKLIPDYLQKRSKEELKKLCLEQIKLMSDDDILQVISGKGTSKTAEEETVVKEKIIKTEKPGEDSSKTSEEKTTTVKEKIIKTEKPDTPPKKEIEKIETQVKKPEEISNPASENASSDFLELHTTAKEMESITNEENPIPVIIKQEVAKSLITPDRDAELLELEMRARAIRSLLKAKSHALQEEEDEENM